MTEQTRHPRERRHHKRKREPSFLYLLWLPLYVMWLEYICRICLLGRWGGGGVGYIFLFSLALGGVGAGLISFGPLRYRSVLMKLFSALAASWASVQTIYFTVFSTFLTLFSVGNGGAALQFGSTILRAIGKRWYVMVLIWVPFVVMALRSKHWLPPRTENRGMTIVVFLLAVVFQFTGAMIATHSASGGLSSRYLYKYSFMPEQAVERFGMMTTLRLDFKQLLFGIPEEPEDIPASAGKPTPTPPADSETPPPGVTPGPVVETPEPTPPPVVYEPNVMDIDFDALIESAPNDTLKNMHTWFSQREPTMQNEYTGAWKGKNLIFIVAEGFSRYAITPETTPTLYRIANEGYVCDEFYNALWWVSTSDGEYVANTSLIPKSGVWSFYRSSNNLMKFALGNQLRAEGYTTKAYHDHTYNYYKRDQSHPNMGYDYKGLGNGLNVREVWPESDVEMMELSVPEYIDKQPFHTYYMTVSGHLNYNFIGNTQAAKHRKEVGHEDFSEEARAYLSCQMELDQAVAYLIEQLDQAGILENTAIVLTGDHYPYGAEKSTINELVGHEVEPVFETYLSTLILWSGDMAGQEPVHITKPVCALDILPTVSNLMGLEYDSRLLMGHDALSDYPGLAVLADRSYITDLGYYNSTADTFTPREGIEVDDDYVQAKCSEVSGMFRNSPRVLDEDYYRVLFG